jgi:hypothetical protein
MPIHTEAYHAILKEIKKNVTLVAVSKTKPVSDIQHLYAMGHRDFGENYVQELTDKYVQLPKDIRWHFIGHLQTNKIKYIIPFVHLIHGVDRLRLLKEIDKEAARHGRVVDCLLQIHIAQEETKFGMSEDELNEVVPADYPHVRILGLMGMASFTDDKEKVRSEFQYLKSLYDKFSIVHSPLSILSMGMSSDYKIAIEEGSNMIRIGSLIFGERSYPSQQ